MNRVSLLTLFCSFVFFLISFSSLSQDVTPPVFDPYEPELSLECSDLDEIGVTATDDSGDPVTITYSDQEFSGGCVPNIFRTYYAEDSSGNVSEAYQVFLMEDLTPPIFMGVGEDMIMSCEEMTPMIPDVIVYDECQEEEIEDFQFEEVISETLCLTVITWTWTAVDFCGNEGSHTKTITIVDETAPVFEEEPEDMFAFCSDGYPDIPEMSATDNCNEVTITYMEEIIEGGTGIGEAAYCTAQDVSFNNIPFSLLLIDSPAQEEYSTSDLVFMQMPDMGDGSTAVLSGNVYGVDNPSAGWYVYMEFENGMDWENWSNQVFPTSYKDDLDNVGDNYLDWTYFILNSTNSQLTGLGDYSGSELILSHTPSNYYYGFQLGETANNFSTDYGFGGWFHAEGLFMDSSSADPEIVEGIEVSHAGDVYTDLNCCPIQSQVRTWTATDACGNSSSVDQVISLIDVMAPEFTNIPEDLLLECGNEIPTELAEATDSCSEVTVTFEDEVVETECEGSYTINRTFTATDECGLSTSTTQIITVVDTTGPILINAPDDLVIDCEDEVPALADVMAMDACDTEVEMTYTEEIVGDMTPEGAMSHCQATTPSNMEDAWSFIMFETEMGDLTAITTEASFTQYEDEGEGYSAVIEANIESVQNPSSGWNLTIHLVNGMNWDDWSNQVYPTSYKDDQENSEDYYQDWMYFILESGTLEGWGDYAGTSLSLSHAPSNHYYGFQMGVQGANVNSEYGIGGWVNYSGTMYDEGTNSIIEVQGSGDLAFDLDCCPTHSILRTWEFTDCSGNTSSHTQTITFDDIEEPEAPAQNFDENLVLADMKLDDMIQVGASPNPMNQKSTVLVDSKVNTNATVKLYNLQGVLVKDLYTGEISSDEVKEILLERGGLPNGIYIIELISVHGKVSSRVIIGEEN